MHVNSVSPNLGVARHGKPIGVGFERGDVRLTGLAPQVKSQTETSKIGVLFAFMLVGRQEETAAP